MKNSLGIIFLAAFFATGFCASSVFAQTFSTGSGQASTSTEALIHQLESQIKALQVRILELEVELGIKPETHAESQAIVALPIFDRTLSKGMSGDDVRNLQQFLAQDKEVYPEGLITAYYGPLTEKAVQRFQEKHNIVSAGTHDTTGYGRVGPKTLARVNELLKEGAGVSGNVPPGLLTAPGIQKKVATTTPPLSSGQATTTPPSTATTTPSGTIPATPAKPIGHTGTTTIPATPAQPATGTPPPPPPGGTPPPSPTPSPIPSPTPPSSTTDTTAPTISNVQATNITTAGATITWTTNESADGKVEYGLTTSYGSSFASTTLATSQSIRISGLQSNTTYHYRVISKDAAGNIATSTSQSFTTASPPSPPPPPPPPSFTHTCGNSITIPQDTPSIQTALNVACTGDTIFVRAGTYYENITVPIANVTLKGAPGTNSETVVIDGSTNNYAGLKKPNFIYTIYVDKTNVTIDGMTIRGSNSGGNGDGITIWGSISMIAKNLIIKDNVTGIDIGAGTSGTITIEKSLITSNNNNGITVSNFGSFALYLTNNTIVSNGNMGFTEGGGGGTHVLRNNIIANQQTGVNVHCSTPPFTILYNNVWNNARNGKVENYIRYDCVGGGDRTAFTPSPGTGELSLDPQFTSTSNYHLKAGSPMINAGDPSSLYNDPDGTRNDMGAYYVSGFASASLHRDLAFILQSLSATLDDIQKQIQKLLR